MPYNFVGEGFHTTKLCSRLSSSEVQFYTWNGHFVFWAAFGGWCRSSVRCYLRLIEKHVLIELFLLGVMAEVLREKVDWKSAFCKGVGELRRYFRIEGDIPTNHFYTYRYANECLTTLSLMVFTQRHFVGDFLQAKCDFTQRTAVLGLWAHLEAYGKHTMFIFRSLESV